MIEHESQTVRAIAWTEVFPWLRLVRVFRLAISPSALLLAAVGALLTLTVWGVVGTVCGPNELATRHLNGDGTCPWSSLTGNVADRPIMAADRAARLDTSFALNLPTQTNPISGTWTLFTYPTLEGLHRTGLSFNTVVAVLLGGLSSIAIWAFFGAAICRIAAVQLAAEERVGLMPALRYACRKWLSYCGAPLAPVAVVLVAALPVLVLGWFMTTGPGLFLGGVLWPLALLAGFLMTVLLVGILFGWPLMWATISTEGSDAFDALNRSYAYTFQKPLHYLFYAVVAGVIGWLGWLLVSTFASTVIWMAYWAAGWGCGAEKIGLILAGSEELSGMGAAGACLIRFWTGCVKLLAFGYMFSYFWSAAAAIYLLLRRDVDATETDEVYLDADASEQTFGLPPITTDQEGAPVVEEMKGEAE